MRRWTVAASIALIAMVSGCAQATLPASSSPPSPSSANSNVPTTAAAVDDEDADEVSAILVRATGLELVDTEDDVITTLSFYEPVDKVVAELALVTGREPVIDRYEGHDEAAPGTFFDWDGIKLFVSDRPLGGPPLYPEWFVFVTAPSVGPLAISTAASVTPGLSQTEVEDRVPGTLSALVGSEVDGEMMAGIYEETEVGRDDEGSALTHSVHIRLSGSPLAVTQIWGPVLNWGDH